TVVRPTSQLTGSPRRHLVAQRIDQRQLLFLANVSLAEQLLFRILSASTSGALRHPEVIPCRPPTIGLDRRLALLDVPMETWLVERRVDDWRLAFKAAAGFGLCGHVHHSASSTLRTAINAL